MGKTKILSLSSIVYLCSFLLPTINGFIGYKIFMLGMAAFLNYDTIILGACWCANIFFLISLYNIYHQRENKLRYSIIAVVCGILFIPIKLLYSNSLISLVNKQSRLQVGYYIWLLSFIIIMIYTIIDKESNKLNEHKIT